MATVVSMTVLALALPAAAHACEGADAGPGELTLSEGRETVLCLINQRRRAAGVRPLRDDPRLERAAQRHSVSMDRLNYFSHGSPGGSSPVSRMRSAGYMAGASSWAVAEIIRWGAGGLATPRSAVAGWMRSAPHRSSVLSRRYRHVGIGVVVGSPVGNGSNAAIYTANLGTRGG